MVTGGVTGRVRPFARDDIPQVAALRQRVFHYQQRTRLDELGAYFEQVFFDGPWHCDGGVPSLVYVDRRGSVAGFLGVIMRPMTFRGERLRVAVGTQLMVAPESRGLVGRRLVRALLRGPQDLSVSDTANEAARLLWQGLGGRVSLLQSLHWIRPVRPARYAAARIPGGLAIRGARRLALPLLAGVDVLAARRAAYAVPPSGATRALDARGVLAACDGVIGDRALRPVYDLASLEWLLQRLAEKRQFGPPRGRLVRTADGHDAGWFLYCVNPGGVCEVVQIAARRATAPLVLSHLLHDGWRAGGVAIAGRFDPGLADVFAASGQSFGRLGPYMLIHSARPELMLAIEQGDAFLSRLEGEWWLSF